MKNKKFIDCYNDWIKNRVMPYSGMCDSLPKYLRDSKEFKIISPTIEEALNHCKEGGLVLHWGVMDLENENLFEFTPLRQTIILLCACMRNEY